MKHKYSIIIPYRDREDHLNILIPALQNKFEDMDYEIIVSEQNDNDNFNISAVQNIATKYATGNVYIFHQVDYVPSDDVSYEINDQPILPARRGLFLDKDGNRRDVNDIPGGYRNWENEIDPNFYGGVIVLRQDMFEKINGFNPMYKGWGNEDEDLRERLKMAGYKPIRNKVGTFYCLHHEDNGDMKRKTKEEQMDFIEGRKLLQEVYKWKHIGHMNLSADVEEFKTDIPNLRWIKSTNYRIDIKTQ